MIKYFMLGMIPGTREYSSWYRYTKTLQLSIYGIVESVEMRVEMSVGINCRQSYFSDN